jgi:hypothetical protein
MAISSVLLLENPQCFEQHYFHGRSSGDFLCKALKTFYLRTGRNVYYYFYLCYHYQHAG